MHLKVVWILIDENIEVLDKGVKEDTQEKGAETTSVTFPIVPLSDRILPLSFFVVAVSISRGDTVVETNNGFSQSDYNTFFAWRSDKSDWWMLRGSVKNNNILWTIYKHFGFVINTS